MNKRNPKVGDLVVTNDVQRGYVQAKVVCVAYGNGRIADEDEVTYVKVRYRNWLGFTAEKWVWTFGLSYLETPLKTEVRG